MIKHTRLALCLCLTFISHAFAAIDTFGSDSPIAFKADELSFDKQKNIVTATGNVEVVQDKDVLTADFMTYDRNKDLLTAEGRVVLHRETGDVIFADYVELTDNLDNGMIKNLRALLQDDARIAANFGQRTNGTRTQLNQAVYSPCKICKNDPSRPPIWQIKALTALWDEEAHTISYTDAHIEFLGVPVLYTPYFYHPDPTVKQQSGILTPKYWRTSDTGLAFTLPYYYVISQDKDITLAPILTQKRGHFLKTEYRQRFSNAKLNFIFSGGKSERLRSDGSGIRDRVFRGHLEGDLSWHVNDHWRVSATLLRATDRTYFKQFPFHGHTDLNDLTSEAKAEGFYGLNYARVRGFLFQGLRATDQRRMIPKVAPIIDINTLSRPGMYGGRWSTDTNALVLTRAEGTNVQRLSSAVQWRLPFTTRRGEQVAFSMRLRGDVYHRNNFIPMGQTNAESGVVARVFPQAYLEWEYPWIKKSECMETVIMPVASLVAAPKLSNKNDFPNEDSFIIEPNDHNIMRTTRFPGLDQIDDGSRLNYGIKVKSRIQKDIRASAFLGQSLNFNKASPVLAGTSFDQRVSDFVGQVSASYSSFADARYRFRLDRNNLSIIRSELLTSFGVPAFKVHVDYIRLPRYPGETNNIGGDQVQFGVSSSFAKGWSTSVFSTYEFSNGGNFLSHLGQLSYENECLRMALQLSKNFYVDQDLIAGTGVMFVLTFKTAGGKNLANINLLRQQFGSVADDKTY